MFAYTVQPGDTLSAIAQHHHTSWRALYSVNRAVVHNPNLIYPGQVLRIIDGKLVPPPNQAARPAPKVSPAAPAPAGDLYTVAFGPQASCAKNIVQRESGGDPTALNPSSGAYGLPQALPGSKMASAGADWRTNPSTQLTWMRGYVDARYGGACAAWTFWQAHGWY